MAYRKGGRSRGRRGGYNGRRSRSNTGRRSYRGGGGRRATQTVRLVIQQPAQSPQFFMPGVTGPAQMPAGFTEQGGLAIATSKPNPRRAKF